MAGITDINWDKLVEKLVPYRLRKSKFLAFLKVAIQPLKTLYTKFKTWEAKSNLDIKRQFGSVAYIEAAINDLFDPTDRRLYISAPIMPTPHYLYVRADNDPVYLNTIYVHRRRDYLKGLGNFTVNVPDDLTIDTALLTATVDRYKRDSKGYTIQYYEDI